MDRAGKPLRVKTHTFRGTVATNYINIGIDPNVTRMMIGQASLRSLKFYVEASEEGVLYYMEAGQLFQVTEKVFKVSLPSLNSSRPSEPHRPATYQTAEEMILAYLSTKELIARQEVEQITGTSSSSAARVLKRMVQNGVLIRIGEGKNTRYKLAKTYDTSTANG